MFVHVKLEAQPKLNLSPTYKESASCPRRNDSEPIATAKLQPLTYLGPRSSRSASFLADLLTRAHSRRDSTRTWQAASAQRARLLPRPLDLSSSSNLTSPSCRCSRSFPQCQPLLYTPLSSSSVCRPSLSLLALQPHSHSFSSKQRLQPVASSTTTSPHPSLLSCCTACLSCARRHKPTFSCLQKHQSARLASNMAQHVATSNTGIPLHCNICPKKPNFSDTSHLLTHVASKQHLSNYFKLRVRVATDPSAQRDVDDYDRWYQDWNLDDLMRERMHQKERRSKGGNGGGGRRASTGSLRPISPCVEPR